MCRHVLEHMSLAAGAWCVLAEEAGRQAGIDLWPCPTYPGSCATSSSEADHA